MNFNKIKTKKKNQKIAISTAMTVSKAQGKVTYKLVSVSKKSFKKYFSINKKKGTLTVKKGLKKGTYKVKIRVKAAGDISYKPAVRNVTIKVKVK